MQFVGLALYSIPFLFFEKQMVCQYVALDNQWLWSFRNWQQYETYQLKKVNLQSLRAICLSNPIIQ